MTNGYQVTILTAFEVDFKSTTVADATPSFRHVQLGFKTCILVCTSMLGLLLWFLSVCLQLSMHSSDLFLCKLLAHLLLLLLEGSSAPPLQLEIKFFLFF